MPAERSAGSFCALAPDDHAPFRLIAVAPPFAAGGACRHHSSSPSACAAGIAAGVLLEPATIAPAQWAVAFFVLAAFVAAARGMVRRRALVRDARRSFPCAR